MSRYSIVTNFYPYKFINNTILQVLNTKHYFKILYIIPFFFLVGCDLCDLKLKSKEECETPSKPTPSPKPAVTLKKALATLDGFKSSVAKEAGANAIVLGSWQSAELGDIFILEDGMATRTSKAYLESLNRSLTSKRQANLSNMQASFKWKRNFEVNTDTGFSFLNSALSVILKDSNVHTLSIDLSLIDPTLETFDDPARVLDHIQSGSRMITGNILAVGLIKSRIKLSLHAFDKNSNTIELNGSVVVDAINQSQRINGGYAETVSQSSSISVIQESTNADSVYAITYLPVSEIVQNEQNIANFLESTTSALTVEGAQSVSYITEYAAESLGGPEVAAFQIQQVRVLNGVNEEVNWSLKIENIDLQRRDLSFNYSIVVTDIFGTSFTTSGLVSNLAPDDLIDEGLFSNHPMYIKNIKLVDIALSLT